VDVIRRVVDRSMRNDIGGLAAEIAFRFLFAVFPFGLFVVALGAFVAGAFHVSNPAGQVISALGDNLPPSIARSVQPQLEQLLTQPRGVVLGVGAIVALLAATGGTNALVKGMHRAYDIPESRPLVVRYVVALALTLLGAVGVLLSFVTIVGGALVTTEAASSLGLGGGGWTLVQLLRWPAVFGILVVAVAILYRYAPNVVVPWRWILVGSATFAIGWLVATALLGVYVDRFANLGAMYGSLGSVVVLMLWFYVTAALLLIGAEVTAALAWLRTPSEIRRRREEDELSAVVDRTEDEVREKAPRLERT
jgi:membrane protein